MKSLLNWLLSKKPTGRASSIRPPTAKPRLEALEDRLLLSSSTGVLSSITDSFGHTTAFAIGSDHQLYKNDGTSSWSQIRLPGGFKANQVAAALDSRYGTAFAYVTDQLGFLYELLPGNRFEFSDAILVVAKAPLGSTPAIVGSSHGFCYALTDFGLENYGEGQQAVYDTKGVQHLMKVSDNGFVTDLGAPGAHVEFVLHLDSRIPIFVPTYQGGTSPREISVGMDQYRRDEVYVTDANYDVWRYGVDGRWQDMRFYAHHISAGLGSRSNIGPTGHDVLYATGVGNDALYRYDGNPAGPNHGFTYLGGTVTQISAGIDVWGLDTCYAIGLNHGLWRCDWSGWHDKGGQITALTAAGNNMVFAVAPGDNKIWAYDPQGVWGGYWNSHPGASHGARDWYFVEGNTASPFINYQHVESPEYYFLG